jgi:hypothetical protein
VFASGKLLHISAAKEENEEEKTLLRNETDSISSSHLSRNFFSGLYVVQSTHKTFQGLRDEMETFLNGLKKSISI